MSRPIVIVVGANELAEHVARAFVPTHDVRRIVDAAVPDALEASGIAEAVAVVAVDGDDRINLEVGLHARALNGAVRIVLSQFSRGLGHKLEQNVPNCSVISPAAHSAATFAAAAIDPACFYGLEFPQDSGKLAGFTVHTAGELLNVAGTTLGAFEAMLGTPILACNGEAVADRNRVVGRDDRIVTFRELGYSQAIPRARAARARLWRTFDTLVTLLSELDPLVRAVLAFGVVVFVLASLFFWWALRLGLLDAVYFVTATLTTVGYGDISVLREAPLVRIVTIFLMFAGVTVTNLAVAFLSAALVRAQWVALQGLRRVHASRHVIVCGAGRVGTRAVEYLHGLGFSLVIVDRQPTATTVRLGRERHIALLTGDATEDETLDLCSLDTALSVVALTDSDAANLEVALGVRARQAEMPVIMRVGSPTFAARIKEQFEIASAFSPIDLSVGAIVGLATSAATRGRITVAGRAYAIEEQPFRAPRAPDARLLAMTEQRALLLVPL